MVNLSFLMATHFLTVLASAVTTLNTRDMATGFFNYCDQGSLTWLPNSNQQAIEADCSTNGEPVYYESWIDLDYCFGNNNGTMAFQVRGGALQSCTCNMGTQIFGCLPNCKSTELQCACDNDVGGTEINTFDLNDYIGLGYDNNNHLVLLCYDSKNEVLVQGSFTQCVDHGDTVDCP